MKNSNIFNWMSCIYSGSSVVLPNFFFLLRHVKIFMRLTDEEKYHIVHLVDEGENYSQTARIIGVNLSTARRVRKRYKNTGTVDNYSTASKKPKLCS